jgi:hypothetical protein
MYEGSQSVSTIPRSYLVWVVVPGNQMAIMCVAYGVHQCGVSNRELFGFRATGMLGDECVLVKHVVNGVAARQ